MRGASWSTKYIDVMDGAADSADHAATSTPTTSNTDLSKATTVRQTSLLSAPRTTTRFMLVTLHPYPDWVRRIFSMPTSVSVGFSGMDISWATTEDKTSDGDDSNGEV
jgi:hypothetical protein